MKKKINWKPEINFNVFFSAIGAFHFLPVLPRKRLFVQSIILSLTLVVFNSISFNEEVGSEGRYSYDYISSYGLPGDVLVVDDEGYLMKVTPQTENEINRQGLTDFAVYEVESGDVLSAIAERYQVSVNSIMWANKLTNPNALKVGQKLLIPPVTGVAYEVKNNDTLEKIAKAYNIEVEVILKQNAILADAELIAGQTLFLPDAKPTDSDFVAGRYGDYRSGRVVGTTATPIAGKTFIFPTRGRISQGFNGGHYAYDIANRESPPVWAAGSGKVIKAAKSGWNGGYGNHVIIDHGNGYQTLYAHFARVDVSVGDSVSQGEVLGIMGTTGRSTGIHLHWEVRKNGVKQNPGYFY